MSYITRLFTSNILLNHHYFKQSLLQYWRSALLLDVPSFIEILNYDPVRLLIESMALSEEQRVSSVSWSIIIFNLDLWKKIPSLFCYWDNGKKFQLYFSCSCDYFKVEQIVTFPTLQQYWHLDHLERAMKDSLEALLCPSINNVYCTTLIPVSSFHALKIFLKKETGNDQLPV